MEKFVLKLITCLYSSIRFVFVLREARWLSSLLWVERSGFETRPKGVWDCEVNLGKALHSHGSLPPPPTPSPISEYG